MARGEARLVSIVPIVCGGLLALVCSCQAQSRHPSPGALHMTGACPDGEIVLLGARIWTGDRRRPAQAMAIRDGRILAIGTDAEIARNGDPGACPPLRLGGRWVLPGFVDAHIHVLDGGLGMSAIDLAEADSMQAILDRVARHAADNPDSSWIVGRGWRYEAFGGERPTRAALDAITGLRPAILRSYDAHTAWVNSRALQLAGIDADTPDPRGGTIVRGRDGVATGSLLDAAIDLVERARPAPTRAEKKLAIAKAVRHALSFGITTLGELGGTLQDLELYVELAAAGQLPARVVFGPSIDVGGDVGVGAYLPVHRRMLAARNHRSRILPGPLKGFVDGVVESNTAAFLEPYSDGSAMGNGRGLDVATMALQIRLADEARIDLAYHAIGDLAVRNVLDAVEVARGSRQLPDRRTRIEHIEIIDASDLGRFARLGVIASMMPLHAEPGLDADDSLWSRKVGPVRLQHAFAFRSLYDAGAALAFGSDWPVMGINPLTGLAIAVTRTSPGGEPPGGWIPAQRIETDVAIAAHTSGAAFALRTEDLTGSLGQGRAADLVVLPASVDLMKPETLFDAVPDLVIVAGEVHAHSK